MPALVLVFSGIGAVAPFVRSQLLANGPHGLTELVYAYASAANNNGSAFSGFSADTAYLNLTLALCMALGRYANRPGACPRRLACRATASERDGRHDADAHAFLRRPARRHSQPDILPSLSLGPYRGGLVMTALLRQLVAAFPQAVRKLDPRHTIRHPIVFVVWVSSAVTTVTAIMRPTGFAWLVTVWLWATVLFATMAEAVAEGRGRAQAAALRATRRDTWARRLPPGGQSDVAAAAELRVSDLAAVGPGEVIPGDGDVVEGMATVDESPITGESAPVIREAGDRCAVTAGTTVLWTDHRAITTRPGETFIDRMIALVEGAARQKTLNEIALTILLTVLTIILLLAVMAIQPLAAYSGPPSQPSSSSHCSCASSRRRSGPCSRPSASPEWTDCPAQRPAMSGRAVEAAGDVSTLLMDKIGTITYGNRMATELRPAPGVADDALSSAAYLSSLADETPKVAPSSS